MSAEEFLIRNTLPEELDQRLPPGRSRSHIRTAIQNQTSDIVIHTPTSTIAAIFPLNYEDPFDEMLWAHFAQDWKDAIYVHRLVVEAEFQGCGIVPKILQFTEALVAPKGKHYLRLDCRGNNSRLTQFYREKSRDKELSGLAEMGTYTNSATGINYARFERLVVPLE
ncbi:hypothetical protein BGZ93_002977 [Podila epicladia]|nr:hypothetical protein BGZ93_002977 [Podila epicladia]